MFSGSRPKHAGMTNAPFGPRDDETLLSPEMATALLAPERAKTRRPRRDMPFAISGPFAHTEYSDVAEAFADSAAADGQGGACRGSRCGADDYGGQGRFPTE